MCFVSGAARRSLEKLSYSVVRVQRIYSTKVWNALTALGLVPLHVVILPTVPIVNMPPNRLSHRHETSSSWRDHGSPRPEVLRKETQTLNEDSYESPEASSRVSITYSHSVMVLCGDS
jgi:hypothetical protein